MELLTSLIARIASILLWPCLILLAVFFARTLIFLGGFAREALDRRREHRIWGQAVTQGGLADADVGQLRGARRQFADFFRKHQQDAMAIEKHLQDTEMSMTRVVERASLASKIGPMLGLMGTLIPLGPALESMGRGNVAGLADNLVVAFATAVVGLAIAGPSFWIASVRRRWYEQDLSDMEFIWRRTTGDVG